MFVRIETNDRLEDRSHHLKGERDEPDLGEAQSERFLQQRVDGGNQRLNGIVQQMTETQGEQNADVGGGRLNGRRCCGKLIWGSERLGFGHKKCPAYFRDEGIFYFQTHYFL